MCDKPCADCTETSDIPAGAAVLDAYAGEIYQLRRQLSNVALDISILLILCGLSLYFSLRPRNA